MRQRAKSFPDGKPNGKDSHTRRTLTRFQCRMVASKRHRSKSSQSLGLRVDPVVTPTGPRVGKMPTWIASQWRRRADGIREEFGLATRPEGTGPVDQCDCTLDRICDIAVVGNSHWIAALRSENWGFAGFRARNSGFRGLKDQTCGQSPAKSPQEPSGTIPGIHRPAFLESCGRLRGLMIT